LIQYYLYKIEKVCFYPTYRKKTISVFTDKGDIMNFNDIPELHNEIINVNNVLLEKCNNLDSYLSKRKQELENVLSSSKKFERITAAIIDSTKKQKRCINPIKNLINQTEAHSQKLQDLIKRLDAFFDQKVEL